MKKFLKILKYVILAALSAAAFILMAHYYYTGGNSWLGRDLEKVCYSIWCLTFAVCFFDVVGFFGRLWAKLVAASATSLLLTAVVFLANNFWRYLSINCQFNWEYSIPYSALLQWDIVHTYGWGEFRYPMVFIITFVVCGLKIFLSHPKIKAICRGWTDRLSDRLIIFEVRDKE